jgi:pimeloyl-ACP methyl ester carboxylesterase
MLSTKSYLTHLFFLGGPGGSGTQFVLIAGRLLQLLLDSTENPTSLSSNKQAKYFDVIGFDPRGVGSTTPAISCFPDLPSRYLWSLQSQNDGVLGSSDNAFALAWARVSALGRHCSQVHGGQANGSGNLSFVNTAPVVADMVAIIEQHGKWREGQAEAWLRSHKKRNQSTATPRNAEYTQEAISRRTRWREGHEQLQYWGFSYGTLLGATFASMEPHRISRVVLDGVVDAEDYYHADWAANLQDTDTLLEKFFDYCYEAGPSLCPLHTGNSSRDIKTRYVQLLKSIRNTPLPVHGSEAFGPGVITYSDVKRLIMPSLYSPIALYPYMARVLADLSNGNGSSFSECVMNRHQSARLWLNGRSEPPPIFCMVPAGIHDIQSAILCSDGESVRHETPDSYRVYWKHIKKQSEVLGDEWAGIRLSCIGWEARPKWRYAGEHFYFSRSRAEPRPASTVNDPHSGSITLSTNTPLLPGPFAGNTTHPVLWIGNTRDPVTPIRK